MHRTNQCPPLPVRAVFDVGLVLLWWGFVLNGDCVKVELIWCLIGTPLWWRIERIECFGKLEQRERGPFRNKPNLISTGTPECFSAFFSLSHFSDLIPLFPIPRFLPCWVPLHCQPSSASFSLDSLTLSCSFGVFFLLSVSPPIFPFPFLGHTLLV